MCGIAGIIRFDGNAIDRGKMSELLGRLAHRGSDHVGLEFGSAQGDSSRTLSKSAEIALGHRRLSILDLSDAASQPMSYDEGRLWITFNGEIYNYIELRDELKQKGFEFKSQSDTEVILAGYQHWGDSCVAHLNGMFAFAIWDENRRRLFCARDQFGIKPFYFYKASNFLAFASESTALRGFHGNALNPDGLAAYLMALYVPAEWSIFNGVSKLLPGHAMVVDAHGRVETKRYWRLERVGDVGDDPHARQSLEESLERAVTRQLRSDVPVGALLSGGVDSGMVVALAAKRNPAMHTYSVGFAGQGIDELPAASQVAAKFGTRHREKRISDGEAIGILDEALGHLSEPIADSAVIPSFALSQMAASDGVKVLLSGTGGDEVFGGYDRYAGGSIPRRLFSGTPEYLRTLAAKLFSESSRMGARLDNIYLDMMFNTAGNFDLCADYLGSRYELSRFLKRLTNAFPAPIGAASPLLYRQMGFDLQMYLPDEILLLFDQMTMAHTIEGRVPLIDVDVVEAAFRFPASSHVKSGKTKHLFRQLAAPHLGHEHVWRQKQGFSGPVSWWINRNPKLFIEAAESVADIPGMHRIGASSLPHRCKRGEIGYKDAHALFILYCFRRWYEKLSYRN